jgi:hypothetical protein
MASDEIDRSRGPLRVAFVFKLFAVLTALGGAATLTSVYTNGDRSGDTATAVIGGTVFGVIVLLFFAYVLEVLVDIRDNSEWMAARALGEYEDRNSGPPAVPAPEPPREALESDLTRELRKPL